MLLYSVWRHPRHQVAGDWRRASCWLIHTHSHTSLSINKQDFVLFSSKEHFLPSGFPASFYLCGWQIFRCFSGSTIVCSLLRYVVSLISLQYAVLSFCITLNFYKCFFRYIPLEKCLPKFNVTARLYTIRPFPLYCKLFPHETARYAKNYQYMQNLTSNNAYLYFTDYSIK